MQSVAVPIPLTVELRPEGADIASLERAICAGLVDARRRIWAGVLARLEASLPVPVGRIACAGHLSFYGRARRRLVTLAGEVELVRRRFRCRECGAETVPLDDALGLEPRMQHTLGVLRLLRLNRGWDC